MVAIRDDEPKVIAKRGYKVAGPEGPALHKDLTGGTLAWDNFL